MSAAGRPRPPAPLVLISGIGPLTVDILDAGLERVRQIIVHRSSSVELPAGVYILHARTSTGERRTLRALVGEGQQPVRFGASRAGAPSPGLPKAIETHKSAGVLAQIELNFWQRRGPRNPWARVEPCECERQILGGALRVEVALPTKRAATFVEVCPPGVSPRFIALPAWDTVPALEIAVHTDRDDEFKVLVALEERQEQLLRILGDHTLESTTLLASEFSRVDQFHSHGGEDPFGMVLGAYNLLRFRALDRLDEWIPGLARWSWLPDGAIIRAWHSILRGAAQGRALSWIVETTRRGIPIFSEGVRLARDAIALTGDPAAERALRGALRSWQRDEALSTFIATDPRELDAALGAAAPAGAAPHGGDD